MSLPGHAAIHVLLVDDDHRALVTLQEMLAEAGFVVSTATSAYQAIQVLHATPIDALVTDVDMPGMSGLELLHTLQATHPWLPAVVITSRPTEEGHQVATALGAVAYLGKPVRAVVFLEAVARAAQARRSTRSAE